jgi:acyl-CoA reductase-like NAD-dependent aldehyde dehydrogenase
MNIFKIMLMEKTLTKLTLELGGKDAVVILNDIYDVQAMCAILMRGVYQVIQTCSFLTFRALHRIVLAWRYVLRKLNV